MLQCGHIVGKRAKVLAVKPIAKVWHDELGTIEEYHALSDTYTIRMDIDSKCIALKSTEFITVIA